MTLCPFKFLILSWLFALTESGAELRVPHPFSTIAEQNPADFPSGISSLGPAQSPGSPDAYATRWSPRKQAVKIIDIGMQSGKPEAPQKTKKRGRATSASMCSICFEAGHNKRRCPKDLNSAEGRKPQFGQRCCTVCQSAEHNKRTCPVAKDNELAAAEESDDDLRQQRIVLLSVAQTGNASALFSLVENGLPVDGSPGSEGQREHETPLHRACLFNNTAMATALLDLGANVNARDEHGFTPLHVAASRGFEDVVELVIARSAVVNARDEGGYTPLHYAAKEGWQCVVNQLMLAGADVDAATTKRRLTPLMLAAMCGEEPCLLQLAYGGANFSSRDCRERTAAAWASALGRRSAAALAETLAALPDPRALLDPGDSDCKEVLSSEGMHPAWDGLPPDSTAGDPVGDESSCVGSGSEDGGCREAAEAEESGDARADHCERRGAEE